MPYLFSAHVVATEALCEQVSCPQIVMWFDISILMTGDRPRGGPLA
jgi:hypothetical protein